ncbi:ATP-binding cassette domain-containing protein [Amycolatopsis sp. CA-230715]|uniref:ATP-binding cassette domain-containing protein n=1 Tax=Amycolatopsis sp. CA-230715 TaxID=2745196 RepID=UPI001C038CC5|nr:ATP-binding cassette domain-containing protein [Amycolatopsis sp. CA-230715]QWF78833.1 putative ABC transporter ATP-binding protein [Amycolatopsis sp. CA-230715]
MAVRDVSFTVARGTTLALVGESGSEKTTTATFDGTDLAAVSGAELRRLRQRFQLVYQNPHASLDPRFTIEQVVAEPLRAFGIGDRRARVSTLLAVAGSPCWVAV